MQLRVKNICKILFDSLVLFIFLLMYRVEVISLAFHETFGLIVLGLLVLHLVYNYRWLRRKSISFFCRKMAPRQRVSYILFALLLIDIFFIGLSGLYISKIYFYFPASRHFWKGIHFCCSAVALVLLGLHIGMHWLYIKSVFRWLLPLPKKILLPIGYAFLLVVCVYGSYNLFETDFVRWLVMPFSGLEQQIVEQAQADVPKNGRLELGSVAPASLLLAGGNGIGNGKGNGQKWQYLLDRGLFPLRIYWPNIGRLLARFGSIVVLFAALEYQVEKIRHFLCLKKLVFKRIL